MGFVYDNMWAKDVASHIKLTSWNTGQRIETDVGLKGVKQTDPKS